MPPSNFLLSLLLASATSMEIQGLQPGTSHWSEKAPVCDNGWSEFDNSCYLVLNNNDQQYADINVCRTECVALGGTLSSIHSVEESNFVTTLVRPNGAWNEIYFTWLGAEEVNGVFRWDDGTPWDFTNWREGEPDGRPEKNGGCVLMGYPHDSPDQWSDGICFNEWASSNDCVCKRSSAPNPTPAPDGSCGANGSLGKCAQCLKNRDCIEDYYCCPYMKKCVNSGQMPCPIPVAYCRPSCYDSMDNHECTCQNEEFPDNWCP